MATIPVFMESDNNPAAGTLSVLNPRPVIKEMDAGKIRESLTQLSAQLSGLFQDIKHVGAFQLTQVQLQVGVTAEGGVALIGVAKAGVSGTITLTFSG